MRFLLTELQNLNFGEHTINWKAPYPRVSMTEAIQNSTGFDITGKTEDELRDFAKSIGIEVDETMGKGKLIDEIFGENAKETFSRLSLPIIQSKCRL